MIRSSPAYLKKEVREGLRGKLAEEAGGQRPQGRGRHRIVGACGTDDG